MKLSAAVMAVIAVCAMCSPRVEGQPAATTPQRGAAPARSNAVKNFTTAESVKTVACSADGKLIAIANDGPSLTLQTDGTSKVNDNWKPSAEVLDAETGKTLVQLKLTSADEDAVLVATERLSHFEVEALAFSPDGNVVAVGTSIGQVKLFNARTGELVRLFDDDNAKNADPKTPERWKSLARALGSVRSVAFSPDGGLLATCGESFADFSHVLESSARLGERVTGSGRVKVWDVKTGTLKLDLAGHSHARSVAFSPDGSVLATAGSWLNNTREAKLAEAGTGSILWNVLDGTKLRAIPTEANGGAQAVAFSPDGTLIAISSLQFDADKAKDAAKGVISIADVASGKVKLRRAFSHFGKSVAFLPNDGIFVMLCRGELWFADTRTGALQSVIKPGKTPEDGRWNDLVTAKKGHMQVMAGVNRERKGSVFVLDPNRPAADPGPGL